MNEWTDAVEEEDERDGKENGPLVPLTEKQREAAWAMVRGGLQMEQLLADGSLTAEEAVAWIRDGRFPEYVMSLARGFAMADAAAVWAALLASAEDGSVPATRLYFDLMTRSEGGRRSETVPGPSPALEAVRASVFGPPEDAGEA